MFSEFYRPICGLQHPSLQYAVVQRIVCVHADWFCANCSLSDCFLPCFFGLPYLLPISLALRLSRVSLSFEQINSRTFIVTHLCQYSTSTPRQKIFFSRKEPLLVSQVKFCVLRNRREVVIRAVSSCKKRTKHYLTNDYPQTLLRKAANHPQPLLEKKRRRGRKYTSVSFRLRADTIVE